MCCSWNNMHEDDVAFRYINRNQILEPVCVALPEEKQRIIIQDSELTVQSIQDPYSFWGRDYNYVTLDNWANDEKVREALHVRKGTVGQFERCNSTLAYTKDILNVVGVHLNLTYTNLRSLIYCADLDMTVPQIHTRSWVRALNLTIAYPCRAWFIEGQVAGYIKVRQRNNDYYLTYVTVKGSCN